tara:strand:+ start:158 stop:1054 length:897 start_codon:yes stop_codon:yes gene_type:complete
MAFKMKGSAFKLGGVQGTSGHRSALKQAEISRMTPSPMKHTGVGKHFHGPMWLPNRTLKSGSAAGVNPTELRDQYKESVIEQWKAEGLSGKDLERRIKAEMSGIMKEWTNNWKNENVYESMPSAEKMKNTPHDPNNPDGPTIMDKMNTIPVSAEDDNPRVLAGYGNEQSVSGVMTTDKHSDPTASSEELVNLGTNEELLKRFGTQEEVNKFLAEKRRQKQDEETRLKLEQEKLEQEKLEQKKLEEEEQARATKEEARKIEEERIANLPIGHPDRPVAKRPDSDEPIEFGYHTKEGEVK